MTKKAEVSVGTKFSVDEISQILELMKENEVNEFRLELGEGKLFLKRAGEVNSSAPVHYAPAPIQQFASAPQYTVPSPLSSPQVSLPSAGSLPPVVAVSNEKKYHELKSPMVGTFYRRPSPDTSPYVQVGDTVKKGQTLCIVEAMKLMNEIQCDASGKVIEILLDDGQMAEYGEILFRIDTGL